MSDSDCVAIRESVKQIISNVTRIPVERIGDDSAFRADLGLDSLSMLEIGVEVDEAFELGAEDLVERLGEMPTVQHVVSFVDQRIRERWDE